MTKATSSFLMGLALAASICGIGATSARAAVIHVPADQPTIQDGINVASSGDTVLVAAGYYSENLTMASGVAVLSQSGPASTTIDGSAGYTVTVAYSGVTNTLLKGFTITGGNGFGGGAVDAYSSGGVIEQNIITANTSYNAGGGIGLDACSFEVRDNDISQNLVILGDGGGISVADGSTALITSNRIHMNSTYSSGSRGGGIAIDGTSSGTISYNVIIFNSAEQIAGGGGGIYCASATAVLDHNTVVDNGLFVPVLKGVTVPVHAGRPVRRTVGRRDGGGGGGVQMLLDATTATLSNNIVGTVAPGPSPTVGNAIYCVDAGSPTFSHNDVWNNPAYNSAPGYGGGCGDQTGTDGNISADPKFCNAQIGDYTLYDDSPCVHGGEGGSFIGALGVGCISVATEPTTWGKVKQVFDRK